MTTKLYYESAYTTAWKAVITQKITRDDGLFVVLDRTAFYPHGGGQPCDRGDIQGVPVLDVRLEGADVLHLVPHFPSETDVDCRIDWPLRFDHMQQHSGQHLLSSVCRDLFQATTVSFHLGLDYCTIDVDRADLTAGDLAAIEEEANQRIYRNLAISSYFVSPEELVQLPVVKPPKVTENIRIVEMQDVEYNACGGTHVSSTGEIGLIKLLKTEKQKGNLRLYFLCGHRALAEFTASQRILQALSTRFKTGKDEIESRLDKWEREQKALESELTRLKEGLHGYMAKEQLQGAQGARLVARIFEDQSLQDLQSLAKHMTTMTNQVVLLGTKQDNKVVLAHNGEGAVSCGAFFKAQLAGFGGSGGGSDKLAQGGFASEPELLAFMAFAQAELG
ncbi:alanyl-tRNA editing protein [Paenibacillus ferrarius]|uniref:alanyl-tRNA editing protein n=1 Tax=Paenibacillus ferrarius TaxID=1469647 RepID=UPI003D2C7082